MNAIFLVFWMVCAFAVGLWTGLQKATCPPISRVMVDGKELRNFKAWGFQEGIIQKPDKPVVAPKEPE